MSPRKSLLIVAALVVMGFAENVVSADPLVLSLNPPAQAGVAGGTVTFLASAFNSGATNTRTAKIVFASFALPSGWGIDFAPAVVNWENQEVANLETRGPLALFNLNIPVGTPDGSYSGSIALEYVSGGANFFTNTVEWTVRVGPATAPVPEPTTIVLLSMGLAGVAAKVKRRRSQ